VVTGCSEGCVVYTVFDDFVVREGVGRHYQDSRVSIGGPGVDRVDLENREKQRGSEGLALLD
jgi:hypothetical protein